MIPLTAQDFALSLKYYITKMITEIEDFDHIIEMAGLWEHDIFVQTFVSSKNAFAKVSAHVQITLENTMKSLSTSDTQSINKLNTLKGLVLKGNTISNSTIELKSPRVKGYYAIWFLTNYEKEFLGKCITNQKLSPTDIHADLLQRASNERLMEIGKEAMHQLQTLEEYIWA